MITYDDVFIFLFTTRVAGHDDFLAIRCVELEGPEKRNSQPGLGNQVRFIHFLECGSCPSKSSCQPCVTRFTSYRIGSRATSAVPTTSPARLWKRRESAADSTRPTAGVIHWDEIEKA